MSCWGRKEVDNGRVLSGFLRVIISLGNSKNESKFLNTKKHDLVHFFGVVLKQLNSLAFSLSIELSHKKAANQLKKNRTIRYKNVPTLNSSNPSEILPQIPKLKRKFVSTPEKPKQTRGTYPSFDVWAGRKTRHI